MCLNNVDKRKKIDRGIGYKILASRGGIIITPRTWGVFNPVILEIGKWVIDPNPYKFIGEIKGRRLKAGFHIFLNIEDAREWEYSIMWNYLIFRVAFREVVQTGTQDDYPTVVAREIKVLEQVN